MPPTSQLVFPKNIYNTHTEWFFCKDLIWIIDSNFTHLQLHVYFSFDTPPPPQFLLQVVVVGGGEKVSLVSLYTTCCYSSLGMPTLSPTDKWRNWICAFLPGVVGGTSSTTFLLLSVFFFIASVLDSLSSIEFIGKGVICFNLAAAPFKSSLDALRNAWKISST